jgi:type I restriction enzyme S subunit
MTQIQKQNVPKLRFPGFEGAWGNRKVSEVFRITRGQVLAVPKMTQEPTKTSQYPVYSSQTKRDGLTGYYSDFLFEDAVTWTTDGANAGEVRYRRGKFYCTNVCGVLLSEDGFSNQFAAESLNRVTHKYVSYVGNPKLMNNVMGGIQYYLPTLPEQRKIASFLGAVDEKIAHLARKKALLEDYKKGCMQQLFSQKIRFKDDDGNDFPDWDEKRLGDFLTVEMGQSPSSDSYNDDGEGLPLVQGNADIKDRKTVSRRFTSAPAKTCEDGDILISVRAPIGEISRATFKACLGRGMASVLPRSGVPDFWYQFLLYIEPMWQRIGQGSTFTAINGADIRKLSTSTPHPAEQRKIADFLSALDRKINLVGHELTHARSFKAGLLQQMFV